MIDGKAIEEPAYGNFIIYPAEEVAAQDVSFDAWVEDLPLTSVYMAYAEPWWCYLGLSFAGVPIEGYDYPHYAIVASL